MRRQQPPCPLALPCWRWSGLPAPLFPDLTQLSGLHPEGHPQLQAGCLSLRQLHRQGGLFACVQPCAWQQGGLVRSGWALVPGCLLAGLLCLPLQHWCGPCLPLLAVHHLHLLGQLQGGCPHPAPAEPAVGLGSAGACALGLAQLRLPVLLLLPSCGELPGGCGASCAQAAALQLHRQQLRPGCWGSLGALACPPSAQELSEQGLVCSTSWWLGGLLSARRGLRQLPRCRLVAGCWPCTLMQSSHLPCPVPMCMLVVWISPMMWIMLAVARPGPAGLAARGSHCELQHCKPGEQSCGRHLRVSQVG